MSGIYRVRYSGPDGHFRELLCIADGEKEAHDLADKRLAENHPVPRDEEHALQMAVEALGSGGVADPSSEQVQARADLFRHTPQEKYEFESVERVGEA